MLKPKHMLLAVALTLGACSDVDDNYIPYDIIAFDVWVYGSDQTEYYGGQLETDYGDALSKLGNDVVYLARAAAREERLGNDWTYIACTVTDESSCVTKVR
jgi:hypothetical protein